MTTQEKIYFVGGELFLPEINCTFMRMDLMEQYFPGQKELTTLEKSNSDSIECPAEGVLRQISGKWKPQILKLASKSEIRFNSLLKKLPGSSKQSLSVALRELEEANLLQKIVISQKPLHIEYHLTERGKAMMPIFAVAGMVAHQNHSPSREA